MPSCQKVICITEATRNIPIAVIDFCNFLLKDVNFDVVLGRFHQDKRLQLFIAIRSARLKEQMCFLLKRPVLAASCCVAIL